MEPDERRNLTPQQQLQQQQQQQELSVLMQRAEGQGVPCNECHAECSHSMSIV